MAGDLDTAYAICERYVRERDKDRFLAGLFAPPDKRRHLYALHAFAGEIAEVRDKITDPIPGEIRLQWWTDALNGIEHGDGEGHPVLAALRDTVTQFSLPSATLVNMVDARVFDLYDDPMPTLQHLVGYAGETNAAIMQLSAIVLNDGEVPSTADIAGHGGVACTMARVLLSLPLHSSRGQLFIPLDMLQAHGATREDVLAGNATPEVMCALEAFRAAAFDHIAAMGAYVDQIPDRLTSAFLTTALARHYLDAFARLGDPFREAVRLPQWRRQWILWKTARKASLLAPEAA